MPVLILGLVLFLGVHSLRLFADGWRSRQRARLGELRWKGLYALVSLIGFALICWGFGLARQHAVLLYVPPLALRHANALFTLIAFVLVAAAYVPRNHLKAAFGHPMLLGVMVWAFGHLLATGMLHDVLLFGAFLLWAVALFVASRRRDRLEGTRYPAGTLRGSALTLVIGVVAWAVFARWLHLWLIGMSPMG
ncbi:NnrU family protein [Rhodanobacter denitrificans]|uniref:NnrU family protein n=1 Tax=Rhodanobacter denitrificans TaxID=666685 RepID=UPI000260DD65|nr:NnrU family protein [Rhodanobacter denitrificans]EIM04068.1 NnrU family protein [Rhodanobacter denitrificans]UJM91003.1 NnrU family protein [Rhodanobacter denitrificans]